MELKLKQATILTAFLCLSTGLFAADKPKKASSKPASVAEITAAVDEVEKIVSKCAAGFYFPKITAELKVKFAEDRARTAGSPHTQELDEARQEVRNLYDTLSTCRTDGSERIKNSSKFILAEFAKRKLRELGADYLVQSQTALAAISDESLFSTENSKLKALRSRIDLELSAQ